jgi:hypothetical protein
VSLNTYPLAKAAVDEQQTLFIDDLMIDDEAIRCPGSGP